MRAAVAENMDRSWCDFAELVWPHVSPEIGGGSLIRVESTDGDPLDLLSGIDQWQQLDDSDAGHALRGLATRVQWIQGSRGFGYTFTIRRSLPSGHPTEYAKRIAAMTRGYLYPHLTIQAYIDRDSRDFISAGIAETQNVIAAASESQVRANADGTTFYWVRFDEVIGCRRVGVLL